MLLLKLIRLSISCFDLDVGFMLDRYCCCAHMCPMQLYYAGLHCYKYTTYIFHISSYT